MNEEIYLILKNLDTFPSYQLTFSNIEVIFKDATSIFEYYGPNTKVNDNLILAIQNRLDLVTKIIDAYFEFYLFISYPLPLIKVKQFIEIYSNFFALFVQKAKERHKLNKTIFTDLLMFTISNNITSLLFCKEDIDIEDFSNIGNLKAINFSNHGKYNVNKYNMEYLQSDNLVKFLSLISQNQVDDILSLLEGEYSNDYKEIILIKSQKKLLPPKTEDNKEIKLGNHSEVFYLTEDSKYEIKISVTIKKI